MSNKNTKTILIAVSVAVLIAVCIIVYVFVFGSRKPEEQPVTVEVTTSETTKATETTVVTTTPPPETTPPVTTTEYYPSDYNSGLYLKAQEYHQINPDVIGWIRVKNTNVNYPILQNGDNDFYMNHDFNGYSSVAGYIFMDYRNYFGENEANHSDNMLIYGHNMGNGSMFNTLHRYKSTSFYIQNPYIEISSLYKDYQYKIYTCMLVNGGAGTDFDFWNYLMFPMDPSRTAEDEFNQYKSLVDSHSIYTTGVDLKLGDKIISLSTCNSGSTVDQTRFVTVARRVRSGENPAAGTDVCVAK